jgi:hypothetical protein
MAKKLTIYSILLLISSITGCTTQSQSMHNLIVNGVVNLSDIPESVAKVEGYDIKAQIRSVYDFNLNTNNQDERLLIIKTLRPDCLNPSVVNEKVTEGTTAIGVTMNWYYMDIKCNQPNSSI